MRESSKVSQEAQLLSWIYLWLWGQSLRTVLPTQVLFHTHHIRAQLHVHKYTLRVHYMHLKNVIFSRTLFLSCCPVTMSKHTQNNINLVKNIYFLIIIFFFLVLSRNLRKFSAVYTSKNANRPIKINLLRYIFWKLIFNIKPGTHLTTY